VLRFWSTTSIAVRRRQRQMQAAGLGGGAFVEVAEHDGVPPSSLQFVDDAALGPRSRSARPSSTGSSGIWSYRRRTVPGALAVIMVSGATSARSGDAVRGSSTDAVKLIPGVASAGRLSLHAVDGGRRPVEPLSSSFDPLLNDT
jgi:hypothetical protein